MSTLEDDMAKSHARVEAAVNRIRAELLTRLDGALRHDLEIVLAGAYSDLMEAWKGPRFDTLKRFAEGNGYLLKSSDRLLQEPPHIKKKREELRDYFDSSGWGKGDPYK